MDRKAPEMSETPAEYIADLTSTMDRDQQEAAISDVSRAVARHYRTLIDSGVPEKRAYKLAKEMQWQWLQGIVPASEIIKRIMLGDDTP